MSLNEVLIVLGMLFVHWFADFVCQTDKQAKGKSKNWGDLLGHTYRYSMIWLWVGLILSNPWWGVFPAKDILLVWVFAGITFVCHTITDYFTSRLNSKLWAEGKVHNFFVSVGFDQWLHYAQLFLTLYYVTNVLKIS